MREAYKVMEAPDDRLKIDFLGDFPVQVNLHLDQEKGKLTVEVIEVKTCDILLEQVINIGRVFYCQECGCETVAAGLCDDCRETLHET